MSIKPTFLATLAYKVNVLAETYEWEWESSSSDDVGAFGVFMLLCLVFCGLILALGIYVFYAMQFAKIYEKKWSNW